MITIFTDGSSRGNPGPGGWGAIILEGKHAREIGGGEKHTTNNRMELTACLRALESLEISGEAITIYTDSQYVSKGITEWIHGWLRNSWKTAAKKPVENKDLWQVLWHNVQGKKIEWKFVRGHAGHAGNERCDLIATSFASREPVELYDGARTKYSLHLDF
jgi:ribonuclease HI